MAQLTDLFAGVIPFVHTAEARSFRRAAEHLGVTPAAVSKAVAKLEDDLGVRLLLRSSRKVSLTPEGDEFLQRCREAIAGVQGAREVVARAGRAPHGEVALTLPYILAPLIVPSLGELGARYPKLIFRLQLTDRLSRMIEEGIDVAVRIGELEDSSLVKRLLRRTRWITLAAPTYLARHPAPASPADLARHNCLRFVAPNGRPRDWTFGGDGVARTVRVEGNLLTDQGGSLLDAAIAGMGVCQVLDFMIGDALRDGRLIEILPGWAADGPPVHALCLPGRERSPNGRALLEFLVTIFKR
jgi:DNA-binding transcriptional LysR family regulator